MSLNAKPDDRKRDAFWQPDIVYSASLFLVALIALALLIARFGFLSGGAGPPAALLLVLFGLFTITMGFPHPGFGHVSFDRVGQVTAILLLGPVDAAWISGLASLLYPWKRLYEGEPLRLVCMASMHNAGLMSLVVIGGGFVYTGLGGPVPLASLDTSAALYLVALIASMQVINDLGMMVIFRLRGQDPGTLLTAFTTAVETGSALIAVLVALVASSYDSGVIVLLLMVLTLGMLVLKRYAEMRLRLEMLVEERTEELRLKSLELERQATHDKLTGLFNRHYADEFLDRQIEHVRRGTHRFSVALADIDHFKRINDRHSHAVGDQVLKRIAHILKSRCRQTDIVARYGGEEFLLCFPDTDADFAERICSDLRVSIEREDWSDVRVGDESPLAGKRVTVSFGIAEARCAGDIGAVLSEADARLYRAKHHGRNRVVA